MNTAEAFDLQFSPAFTKTTSQELYHLQPLYDWFPNRKIVS
ncbi:MAG: hypothetical protein ABFC98_05405 [Candidatus Cloacimonas sp.]